MRELSFDTIRATVGVVPQDAFLFSVDEAGRHPVRRDTMGKRFGKLAGLGSYDVVHGLGSVVFFALKFGGYLATGSTAVSQLVDSFIVLYIAFVLGPQHWPIPLFLAAGREADLVVGADGITIHVEAAPHLHRQLQRLDELGAVAGVALNPGTSLASLDAVVAALRARHPDLIDLTTGRILRLLHAHFRAHVLASDLVVIE